MQASGDRALQGNNCENAFTIIPIANSEMHLIDFTSRPWNIGLRFRIFDLAETSEIHVGRGVPVKNIRIEQDTETMKQTTKYLMKYSIKYP